MIEQSTGDNIVTAVNGRRSAWKFGWLRVLLGKPVVALSVLILTAIIAAAVLAPVLGTRDVTETDFQHTFAGSSVRYPLGTDELGRDTYSRLILSARVALKVGLGSVALGLLFGVPFGLGSGYIGGALDEAIMRLMDVLYSFPAILLAMLVVTSLGSSTNAVMLAVGITFVPAFARVVRASTLSVRPLDFVTAAIASGASRQRVLLRHVLPNAIAPVLIQASLAIGSAIIAEASLSFLGLGQRPPQPSWGSMLLSSQRFLSRDPRLAFLPGVAIFITVLSFNLVGDALRDALDPRIRHR